MCTLRPLAPAELRARGFEVLCEALGWMNAVRFVQQYESLGHNYVVERELLFGGWTADRVLKEYDVMVAPRGDGFASQ